MTKLRVQESYVAGAAVSSHEVRRQFTIREFFFMHLDMHLTDSNVIRSVAFA